MKSLRQPQFLWMLTALLLVAATFTHFSLELEQPVYRYVFVFDISQSMNVVDVPGDDQSLTRLNYAKQATLEALKSLPCGTDAGLALFTGHRAYLLTTPVEICDNYREMTVIVNNIDWRMTWAARSEIAKGLFKSIGLLEQLGDDTRLVFISDGQEAPLLNPEVPPHFPGERGKIKGLVIGVGGDTPVPIPKFDLKTGEAQGYWKAEDIPPPYWLTVSGSTTTGGTQQHLSSLQETYLQQLADKTGLVYHRLGNVDDYSSALQDATLGNPQRINTDMRWLLALLALLALIAVYLPNPYKVLQRRHGH